MNFGRAMLAEWALEPGLVYLNHGTVGATPRRVLAEQQRLRDAMEAQPSRFLLRDLYPFLPSKSDAPPLMREAAEQVATFVGARGEDLVFVDNATAGINAVLGSFDFRAGDEIVMIDLAYGAIAYTARYVARRTGARVVTVPLPYPPSDPGAIVAAISAALSPATRIAIVDHVTSESALVLPLAEITRACAARGVPVLADGAHAPGALDLDIPSLGVDWYTGNLHKWAWAPRSCGILWAKPERQAVLHPPVISWGLDRGFTLEFDWVGTRDPSPYLAAPAAIRFMEELGAEAIRAYNHRLAWDGARLLAQRWKTEPLAPEAMIGCMATIALPVRFGASFADACRLRDALLFEDRIEIQIHPWRDRLWLRLSAQIYNDLSDIERLAEAVERL